MNIQPHAAGRKTAMREYPANDDQDYEDHQEPPDAEGVPPDLKSIHRQMVAEGQLWQRSLPATQRLIERTQRLTMSQALASPQTPPPIMQPLAPTDNGGASQSFVKGSRDMMTSQETNRTPSRTPSRMRSLWAGLAAIVVVALLAGVFYALASSRRSSGPASVPTATAQAHGKWQTLASLPFSDPPQGPVIAPSDPNTVYEATLSPLKLRRTTDQGAHWTELHVPGDTSNLESFQVFVSPLDAKMVFVTLTSPLPPKSQVSACPTIPASQASTGAAAVSATRRNSGAAPLAGGLTLSGNIPCSLQYYSTDGGASWKQLTLPIRAALVNPDRMFALPSGDVLSAQGNRLYAAAGCGPQCSGPSDDIVTSADGGAHWAVADQQIRAAGHDVCDFGAAPSGSEVFAITSTESCGNESAPLTYLWHSTDAGAHWAKVRQLPANGWTGMAVVSQPSGQPLLYIHMPQVTAQSHMDAVTDGPTHLMVSADGGKTWTAAPASGIAGSTESPSGPLCVLSDGTVIEYFGDPTTAVLYGWKLGATTWRMVAPSLKGDVRQMFVARQGESDALFAVTSGAKGIAIQSYLP
jgi:BNR/Asp-box repeat protein